MWIAKTYFIPWQTISRWIKLALLVPIIALGSRTYFLYQKLQTFETCSETIDFLIQHKTTFLFLYHTKTFQTKLVDILSSKEKPCCGKKKKRIKKRSGRKPVGQRLATWLEGRLLAQLMDDSVKSVKDLPVVDRSIIRAMDGTTYMHSIWRQALCFLTFNWG